MGTMPAASTSHPALDELLPTIVDGPGIEALKAYRAAQVAGYTSALVLDHNPGCMRGDIPQAWTLDAFFVHMLRTDGLFTKRRHDHTSATVTVGSRDDDRGYGQAMGGGPA